MDKKTKRNFIIILLITFLVMILSFKNDYQNILGMFRNIDFRWFIVAVMIMVIYNLLDVYFFHYYFNKDSKIRKRKYTFRQALEVQQTGNFFSAITPFASGGQFAQVMLFSKQKITTEQSASVLMLSFISWQTVLVIFTSIALVAKYNHFAQIFSGIFRLVFIGYGINVIVIVGLFLAAFSEGFHRFIFNTLIPFLGKLHLFKNVVSKQEEAKDWLALFKQTFALLLNNKDILIRRVVLDTLKIFTFYSIPFFAAKALNIDIPFNRLLEIIVLSSFVFLIAAFIPIPGAAGGTEGTFLLLLGPIFGVGSASVMLLWRFLTYYLVMFVGFLFFANIKEMKADKKS